MLVDLVGIEPTTSSMPWKRAPSCATGPLLEESSPVSSKNPKSIVADIFYCVNVMILYSFPQRSLP